MHPDPIERDFGWKTSEQSAEYEQSKVSARELYKTFVPIRCPALKGESVHFTSEGFNHLVYRIKKQERDKRVQVMRFRLLPFAKQLLEKTTTIQEYEEYPKSVQVINRGACVQKSIQIKDFGFVGLVGKYRIKVVVRKKGNGNYCFHSVIPAWSTRYYHDIKVIRNTKGNVAED